ncbi:uncharacterized protein AAES06_014506 [Glossophaga mutica]
MEPPSVLCPPPRSRSSHRPRNPGNLSTSAPPTPEPTSSAVGRAVIHAQPEGYSLLIRPTASPLGPHGTSAGACPALPHVGSEVSSRPGATKGFSVFRQPHPDVPEPRCPCPEGPCEDAAGCRKPQARGGVPWPRLGRQAWQAAHPWPRSPAWCPPASSSPTCLTPAEQPVAAECCHCPSEHEPQPVPLQATDLCRPPDHALLPPRRTWRCSCQSGLCPGGPTRVSAWAHRRSTCRAPRPQSPEPGPAPRRGAPAGPHPSAVSQCRARSRAAHPGARPQPAWPAATPARLRAWGAAGCVLQGRLQHDTGRGAPQTAEQVWPCSQQRIGHPRRARRHRSQSEDSSNTRPLPPCTRHGDSAPAPRLRSTLAQSPRTLVRNHAEPAPWGPQAGPLSGTEPPPRLWLRTSEMTLRQPGRRDLCDRHAGAKQDLPQSAQQPRAGLPAPELLFPGSHICSATKIPCWKPAAIADTERSKPRREAAQVPSGCQIPGPGHSATTIDPTTCSQVCVPPACRKDSRGLRSAESVSKAAGSPAASRLPSTSQSGRRTPAHRPKPPASARAPGAAARPAGSCSLQPASARSGGGPEPQLPRGPAAALTQTAAGGAAAEAARWNPGPATIRRPASPGRAGAPARVCAAADAGRVRVGRRGIRLVRGVRIAAASRTCYHAGGQGLSGVPLHGKGPDSLVGLFAVKAPAQLSS